MTPYSSLNRKVGMVIGVGLVLDVAALAAASKQPSDIPLLSAPPATQMSTVAQRLAAVNATPCGTFQVESDCLMSHSVQHHSALPKTIQVIVDSEMPLAAFIVSDSGTCAIGDRSMADIFRGTGAPLRDCLRARPQLRADVRGDSFSLGDFVVNIGLASVGQQCRGCVAEIRYLPGVAVMPIDAWVLIFREFIAVALGFRIQPEFFPLQHLKQQLASSLACCGLPPNANSSQMSPSSISLCSAVFVMTQYAGIFTALRKPQEQSTAPTAATPGPASASATGQSEKA